jgi:hypothetical protein
MPADGTLRLPLEQLRTLHLQHFLSGLDPDSPPAGEGAWLTSITGFTEWVSAAPPLVTVGWDWQMHGDASRARLRRVGPPRSNLLLESHTLEPVDMDMQDHLLQRLIDALDWENESLRHLSIAGPGRP